MKRLLGMGSIFLLIVSLLIQVSNAKAKPFLPWQSLNQSYTIIDTLDTLTTNYSTKIDESNGSWYHLKSRYSLPSELKRTYPDGSLIPTETIHETWYTLSTEGNIKNGVSRVFDIDGKVIQEVVFINSIAYNLTFPEYLPSVKLESSSISGINRYDFNFFKNLNLAMDEGNQVTITANTIKVDMAGDKYVVSYSTQYVDPIEFNQVEYPVLSSTVTAIYNLQTGSCDEVRTIFNLESGNPIIYRSETILVEKMDSATAEINQVIEEFGLQVSPSNGVTSGSGLIPGTNIYWNTSNEVRYISPTYFDSASMSSASAAIGTIGWTTRSNQVWCNGTVIDGEQFGGLANYNSMSAYIDYSNSGTFLTSCQSENDAHRISVNTYHQFVVSASNSKYVLDGDSISVP
ncbi:MAG: hypothetical protein WA116_05235 [Anaerolineaceae bacterium]